ncbi:MAG: hypothetical protein M1840_008910 [Geoglossum simile]|nr:MAG: hypothetical protein M1840_008910 [Geoglossum simile]
MVDIVRSQNLFTLTAYYKQVLYLTCLRTDPKVCTNPACSSRALDQARKIEGCSNDGNYAGDFEHSVFEPILANPDFASLPAKTIEVEKFSWALGAFIGIGPFAWFTGISDPRTIGAVYLGPGFTKYIDNIVSTSTTEEELQRRIAKLKAEHEQLFKCAVRPGFIVEMVYLDLPVFNSVVAAIGIPWVAAGVRNSAIVKAEEKWRSSQRRRRDFNPTPEEESLLKSLGIIPPLSPQLRGSLENWLLLSAAPNDTAEFSGDVYASGGISLNRSLEGEGISFALNVVDRPTTLVDRLGYMSLLALGEDSTHGIDPIPVQPAYAPSSSSVLTLGPIAALFPSEMFTSTNDSVSLLSSALAATPTISLPPSAAAPPPADQSVLFFSEAKIEFTVPAFLAAPYSSLAIVDLLTGAILPTTVSHTDTPSGDCQVLSAIISPTKGGIWGGDWRGGGIFAVAVLGNDGTPLHSLSVTAENSGEVTPTVAGSADNSISGTAATPTPSASPTTTTPTSGATTTGGNWAPGWWVSKAFWG